MTEPEQREADGSGWLARDNEPDAGPWNTGLGGINLTGTEHEAEPG